MQALVLTAYNTFEIQDAPEPELGPEDVLIRVGACGICGSDIHGMDGSSGRRRPPIIMGHEAAGTVVRAGDGVTEWQPGDRVTFDSTVYCGACDFCKRGQVNLCDNRRVLGVSCEEYRQHGAFAEFIAVPQRILYRLPDKVSFEHAAMVEPVSIVVHAVARAGIGPEDTVAVIGTGMIGLLVVPVLRARGCKCIVAVDLDESRLALAKRFGASETLLANAKNVAESIRDATGGAGVDATFEVVGASASIKVAVESVRKGGSVTLIGNLAPTVDLPLQQVVTRELTLLGSCASSGEYPECLALMASGAIDVDPLISAVAPLHEGAEWFHRLYRRDGALMKVLLRP
ncbi:MAG: alcohol dehydrogenase [Candidatus Hydrogenedentota bacterium]